MNSKIFLRDPQETKLGLKIIGESIHAIHELGFEAFTFKKLSERIESTEASIYRYFENKHKLLLYLSAWYWEWLSFQISYASNNLETPKEKLNAIIQVLATAGSEDSQISFINEKKLHAIMVADGVKVFHIKDVDLENRQGLFKNFKDLSAKVADVLIELNPSYPFPNSLATILIETAFNQLYYAEHLPRLTNLEQDDHKKLEKLLLCLCKEVLDN